MNELGLAIRAQMRLYAKIPLITLLRLAYVGVAAFVLVLGRGRRIDDRGIHNGVGADL